MESKIKEIIELLISKFDNGKLKWGKDNLPINRFSSKLKDKRILLSKGASNVFYIALMDENNKTIFNQRIHSKGGVDEMEIFTRINIMYKKIEREASGIDEKLDEILGDLNEI